MPWSFADLACACQHDRPGVSERFRRPHRPGDEVAGDSGSGRWGTDYAGARTTRPTAMSTRNGAGPAAPRQPGSARAARFSR